MRIQKLNKSPEGYSSNSYLIRGDFNSMDDKNVLIDTGGDNFIIEEIEQINTGAGKKKISEIVLTHNHFDHTGGVKSIKEKYNCEILAFSKSKITTRLVKNGEFLKFGDESFEVMHCPTHSNDSILLYGWDSKNLFCGDVDLAVINKSSNYPQFFKDILQKLITLGVKTIYPGHGPLIRDGTNIIKRTLKTIDN